MKTNKYFKRMAVIFMCILCGLAFLSCASNKKSNKEDLTNAVDYGFHLIEPENIKPGDNIIVEVGKPLKIKINLNKESLKDMKTCIIKNTNGYRHFQEGSTSQIPFEDTFYARDFFDGTYEVEYFLMPEGRINLKWALASVKLNLEVKGSINAEQKQEINDCIDTMLEAIYNNDIDLFRELFISQDEIKNLEAKLKANTIKNDNEVLEKDKEANALLEKLKSEDFMKTMEKNFNGIQEVLKMKNIDVEELKLMPNDNGALLSSSSAFQHAFTTVLLEYNDFFIQPWCSFIVIDNKVLLAQFLIDPGLIE